jgi:hypothetical protein
MTPEAKEAAEAEIKNAIKAGLKDKMSVGYYVQQAIDAATAKLREESDTWRLVAIGVLEREIEAIAHRLEREVDEEMKRWEK